MPTPVLLQYPCRWLRGAIQPVCVVCNAAGCSNPEQSLGAVVQGIPLPTAESRRAGWRYRHVVALLLVALLPPAIARDACEGADVAVLPTLLRVSANVWRVVAARGEPEESNRGVTTQLVLARDRDRLWLIGSGPSPAFGAALSCAVQRTTGHTVSDVVNTRSTPELAMGNVAFANARLWALPDVMAAMQTRCLQCQAQLRARLGIAGISLQPQLVRVPRDPVAAAGVTTGRLGPFEWRALERMPGERVLVLRHCHDRIVVAQGLLWADDVPDLRDTRSDTLLASWRTLLAFSAGSRLLGEQGGVVGPAAVGRHITYLESLRRAVEPSLIRGDLQGASGSALELTEFASLPGYAIRHPINVQRVWLELEPTIFR